MSKKFSFFIVLTFLLLFYGCSETGSGGESVCDNVSCSGRGECVIDKENKAVCMCNDGYHAEGVNCIIDALECGVTEHEENGKCLSNSKIVDCLPPQLPENAQKVDSKVEITWRDGSWTIAKTCEWICMENFHRDGDLCKENTLNCSDDQHEESSGCVDNTKMVDCIDVSPENADTLNVQTEITWENGQWSETENCEWNCIEGYHKAGNICEKNTAECSGIQEGENCRCEGGVWWELDFDTDPTLSGWHLRDDSAFDTSELNNGVWKTSGGEYLDSLPHNNFDKSTSVHLKFRNTSIGGRGAVFWINADFSSDTKTSIYASLTLQDNDTQILTIYSRDNNGEVELVSYSGLPASFIDLWLLLDTDNNKLTVWVENEFKGIYSYPVYNSTTDPFATLLAWGSDAEFDFVRIETCSDGANHPEITDTEPPVITLNGDNPMHIIVNNDYNELGATAMDNMDGEINVTITGSVDTTQTGEYTITYSATDSSGNNASIERKVFVDDEPNVECANENIRCVGNGQEYTKIQSAIDEASSGDTVMIFAGIYYEQVNVTKNLVIRAVENNDVVISGEKNVVSWQYDSSKGLYYADSPCDDVQSLFINGEEKKASRYPDDGSYLNISNAASKSRFSVSGFGLNNENIKDAMAHIRMSHWRVSSRRVVNYESNYLNLESDVDADGRDISSDYKVFFTQVFGKINDNGEWAWHNNKIYLKSDSTPQNVTVACNEYGIYLEENAKNVEIYDLNITKINGYGITKKSDTRKNAADDIIIKNNKISYVTEWGILIRDFYRQNERLPADTIIQNNEIHHARSGGIQIFASNALIDRNYIHEIGASKYNDDVLSKGCGNMLTGIYIYNSSGAVVSNNRLNNIGYNGISVANGWAGWVSNGDRVIENNYITNAVLALNDGACIYTYTNKIDYINAGVEPERDTIRNNIAENCIGSFIGTNVIPFRQGEGIYLDDLSSYTDVYNNTVIGATKNLYLHNSFDVNVENNTFISPDSVNILVGQAGAGGEDRENVFIRNNKILSKDVFTYMVLYNDGQEYLTDTDNNIIRINEGTTVKIRRGYSTTPNITFDQWKGYGYDEDSVVIQDSTEPVILINPSLSEVTFSNLQGCKDFNNTSLNQDSITVLPYQSKVLFNCSFYTPGTYTESVTR